MTGQTPEQPATHAGDAAAAVAAAVEDALAGAATWEIVNGHGMWTLSLYQARKVARAAVVAALPQPATDTLAAVERVRALAHEWAEDDSKDPAYALWLLAALGDAGAGQTGAGS